MNSHSAEVSLLGLPLVLLAAAVISVPIARFLKLSAIVAYLVAGVVIGPFGLGIFSTARARSSPSPSSAWSCSCS